MKRSQRDRNALGPGKNSGEGGTEHPRGQGYSHNPSAAPNPPLPTHGRSRGCSPGSRLLPGGDRGTKTNPKTSDFFAGEGKSSPLLLKTRFWGAVLLLFFPVFCGAGAVLSPELGTRPGWAPGMRERIFLGGCFWGREQMRALWGSSGLGEAERAGILLDLIRIWAKMALKFGRGSGRGGN